MIYDNGWRNQQLPNSYQNGSNNVYGTAGAPYFNQNTNASYAPQPMETVMKWVDGEVGAKAFQLPQGWPPNTPFPLWDSNEPVIYFKSYNNSGMPNPLQKAHYKMEEYVSNTMALPGQSSNSSMASSQNADYVTKEDLRNLRDELMGAMNSSQQLPRTSKTGGRNNESAV